MIFVMYHSYEWTADLAFNVKPGLSDFDKSSKFELVSNNDPMVVFATRFKPQITSHDLLFRSNTFLGHLNEAAISGHELNEKYFH